MAGVSLYLLKDCEMHFFKLVQYVFTVFCCCCCLFLSKNKFNLLVVLLVSPFTFSLRRPLAFLSQCFSEVQVSTWIWRNWTFHTDTECHRKELHVTLYLETIFKLCTPKLYQCYSWQLFKKKKNGRIVLTSSNTATRSQWCVHVTPDDK